MAPLRSGALSTQDNEDERTSSHVQSSNARGKSNTPSPPPPPITRQALDLQLAVANLLTESTQRTNSSNDPGTSGLLAANTDLTGTHQRLPTTNDPGIPVLPAAHTGESRCLATAMQLVFQPPFGNAYTGMLTFSGRLHIVFRILTFHCTAHACIQHG